MDQTHLISDYMRKQNSALHARPEGFGGDGWKHVETVLKFARTKEATNLLDYGCGEGALKQGLLKRGFPGLIAEYDPAIPSKAQLPSPADLVVCTDVLEHVEPDLLDNVLEHLFCLTKKVCFMVVATRPANKILPDGRNAHLIVESAEWWKARITRWPWALLKEYEKRKGDGRPHDYQLWLHR